MFLSSLRGSAAVDKHHIYIHTHQTLMKAPGSDGYTELEDTRTFFSLSFRASPHSPQKDPGLEAQNSTWPGVLPKATEK